jgi:hypothetical protein
MNGSGVISPQYADKTPSQTYMIFLIKSSLVPKKIGGYALQKFKI